MLHVRHLLLSLLAAFSACLGWTGNEAKADIIISLSTSKNGGAFSSFTGSPISLNVGEFADIRFSAQMNALLADSGSPYSWLQSYGIQFNFSSGAGVATLQPSVVSAANLAFSGNLSSGPSVISGVANSSAQWQNIAPTINGGSPFQFAQVRFTATAAGTSSTLSFVDPSSATSSFNLGDIANPGNAVQQVDQFVYTANGGTSLPFTVTFNVSPSAVPEPSSLLLIGGAVSVVGMVRMRRKRRYYAAKVIS